MGRPAARRHEAVFSGIRATSTLGSFLRSFIWGNALQAEKVSRLAPPVV